jgi:hypothetical protein
MAELLRPGIKGANTMIRGFIVGCGSAADAVLSYLSILDGGYSYALATMLVLTAAVASSALMVITQIVVESLAQPAVLPLPERNDATLQTPSTQHSDPSGFTRW